jgi:predicted  nucleic acid-binding Zn-ribbon protein
MSNEENLIAMNMKYGTESVQYFYKQGKLTEDQFNEVSGVIKSLFKIINDSQKNYNSLNETMRILKKDLTAIKHEYEAANNRQAEVTEETEKLSRALKTAEVAYESQKASYENLLFEADELDK